MKFIVYVPPFNSYYRCHMEVWDSILKCEGKTLHVLAPTTENSKKCMVFHRSDLVKYFKDNGLMRC